MWFRVHAINDKAITTSQGIFHLSSFSQQPFLSHVIKLRLRVLKVTCPKSHTYLAELVRGGAEANIFLLNYAAT